MNTKMVIAGLIAAAAALSGSPAYAAGQDPVADWVKQVNRKLDRNIAYPTGNRHGVAYATFRRTADGRAEMLSVESKDRALERAARITLKRLRDLPPEPKGMKGSTITLQMLIGDPNDPRGYHQKNARMLASADERNKQVAARLEGTRLALNEAR